MYFFTAAGDESLQRPFYIAAPRTDSADILLAGKEAGRMCNGGPGGGLILGICAVALGAGILIAAIFPVGALMLLVAFLLIACGLACCKR